VLSLLDIDGLRMGLPKTHKPRTVRNVLALLRRLIKFGVKGGLIGPPSIKIELPQANNIRPECLTPEQPGRLLDVLREIRH
jgi:hypothetical protein